MNRLKIFLNGQYQNTKELDPSHTFLAGRGESCDVVLNAERGVSRQHFQIQNVKGVWRVKVLSKFGELYSEGHKVQDLELRNALMFSVPPYDFVFESDEEAQVEKSQGHSGASIVVSGSDDDRTHIGFVPSAAFLRLVNAHGDVIQSYRLDGQSWVGGRDLSCSIFIDNQKISRRQFEIYKQDEAYFVRDLGSVNVTQVNSRPIPAETWTQLTSMDVISVADWMLHFEMRDAQFEHRLQEVAPNLRSPVIFESGNSLVRQDQNGLMLHETPQASPGFASIPGNQTPPVGRKAPAKKIKMNPVRIAILAITVVGLGFFIFDGSSKDTPEASKRQTPFEKLPVEKQQYVKQAYLAAQAHLAQGNYELARQEIVKIHQEIPVYEDSKQIEAAAARGVEMLAEMEKLQQQEAEKKQIDEKVNATIRTCKAGINKETDLPWLEQCLAPIMEFNPDHPGILELKAEVESNMQERAMNAAASELYRQNVAKFKAIFQKAEKIEKSGQILEAIKAYSKIPNYKLPDPGKLKEKAKRQVAALSNMVQKNQEAFEKKADAAHAEERFRDAVEMIRKAVSFNPENEAIKGKQRTYEKALTKSLMPIYHEGILEENVGNVEVAKKKWQAILEASMEGEEYFKKAKAKLKKYGAL